MDRRSVGMYLLWKNVRKGEKKGAGVWEEDGMAMQKLARRNGSITSLHGHKKKKRHGEREGKSGVDYGVGGGAGVGCVQYLFET